MNFAPAKTMETTVTSEKWRAYVEAKHKKISDRAPEGTRVSKLTVCGKPFLTSLGSSKKKHTFVVCLCDCGEYTAVRATRLFDGLPHGCGCTKVGRRKGCKPWNAKYADGERKHRLYGVWYNMRSRCYHEKNQNYKRYGAKGIGMFQEWRDDYRAFKLWAIANGWKPGLHCDRIDPEKDYCPDNCRFITPSENSGRVVACIREKYESKISALQKQIESLKAESAALEHA